MSNGVHPRHPAGHGDSGTQPAPHHCTSRPREDGTVAGCPNWPGCLFPNATSTFPAEPPHRPTVGLVETLLTVVAVVIVIGLLWAVVA